MKACTMVLVACISLIPALAFAHGNEQHVVGTVTKIVKSSITVKTTANKEMTIAVIPETKFMKAKATAQITDLTVGDRVVVHAKEIIEGNLIAETVEFNTVKPAPIDHSGHVQQSARQLLNK